MQTPNGITYEAIYEPDKERMVKALRILLEYKPRSKSAVTDVNEAINRVGGEHLGNKLF